MEIEDTGTAPVSPAATEDLRVEPSEAPAETSSEPSIDSTLQAIWDKQNPHREDDGKFASRTAQEPAKEGDAPVTETEVQPPEAEAPEQAKPAIEPPISWTREMKEKWSALPPDTQEYLATRDRESNSKISQLGNEVATLRPIASVIEQHREVFSKHQVSPDKGIELLLNYQRKLDANPRATIEEIAKVTGVDLSTFGGGGEQGSQTPQIATMQSELVAARRELSELRDQIELAPHLAATEKFFTGKSVSESEANELTVLIKAEVELNRDRSAEDVLSAAWQAFQYRNPERREALISQRQAETEAKRKVEAENKAAEAKKLGSLNVKSSPGSSSASRSMDDVLKEIAQRAYGKR